VRRVSATAAGPTDAVAGRPFDIEVTVLRGSHIELKPLLPVGEAHSVGEPSAGLLRVVAPVRGLLTSARIEFASAAPFGLARARSVVDVPLAHTIEVAPRVIPVRLPPARAVSVPGDDSRGNRHGQGETVRTVREYMPGDPMRMMHWPATARADQPIVKELEAPDAPHLVIRVDLNAPFDEAERRASEAAGLVLAGLAAGLPVSLHTAEGAGPHAGPAGSMLEAGRRLARAIGGPLPPLEVDARSTVIIAGTP
ncbi:MAG: DUF58 domain-containing protein, partial [Acidimicrobiia bacterium]|nr:DUF58 domain-containing protein [Acidimicrobiia bacterium]